MTADRFRVEAVLADQIGDEKTAHSAGRPWRVAFYKNLRLYAVVDRCFTKAEATRMSIALDRQMNSMVDDWILSIARSER